MVYKFILLLYILVAQDSIIFHFASLKGILNHKNRLYPIICQVVSIFLVGFSAIQVVFLSKNIVNFAS